MWKNFDKIHEQNIIFRKITIMYNAVKQLKPASKFAISKTFLCMVYVIVYVAVHFNFFLQQVKHGTWLLLKMMLSGKIILRY